MLDMIRNPEDRFSLNKAQIMIKYTPYRLNCVTIFSGSVFVQCTPYFRGLFLFR